MSLHLRRARFAPGVPCGSSRARKLPSLPAPSRFPAGFPGDSDVPTVPLAGSAPATDTSDATRSDDPPPINPTEPSGLTAHMHINLMTPLIMNEDTLKLVLAEWFRVISVGE